MPVYEFKGFSGKGKRASGIVDADSPKAARVKLRRQGILATSVNLETGARELRRSPLSTIFNRITVKDIAGFTRQLATLQAAGLTLIESLDALMDQAENLRFRKVITDIREQVSYGSSLADSLAAHPSYFDSMYVNLVRAGESSGALESTLGRLAQFNENRLRRRSKIAAAMIYPVIMTFVGCGVLFFLLGYVVPKTQAIFEDMNQVLPLPTLALLAISDFISSWWGGLTGGFFVLSLAVRKYMNTETGRLNVDKIRLRLPVFGKIYRAAAIARFASALGVLLAGGVELIEALKITEKAVDNAALAQVVKGAVIRVTEGQTIADPLRESGLFPPIVVQMISAGERSGALEEMLDKIAEAYDFEVETAVTAMTSLIEPVLILVMWSVVGFIVISILLPIFDLSQVMR